MAPQEVQEDELETSESKIDFSFDNEEEEDDEAFKEDITAPNDEGSGQHYFEEVAFHTGKNASSLSGDFSSSAETADDGDYEKVQVISG